MSIVQKDAQFKKEARSILDSAKTRVDAEEEIETLSVTIFGTEALVTVDVFQPGVRRKGAAYIGTRVASISF